MFRILCSWIYNYLCNQCLWVRTLFRRGVLDTTLFDKVCQWLATGRWISPGHPVCSTNRTDRHDITAILLKVALNTTTLTQRIKKGDFFSIWKSVYVTRLHKLIKQVKYNVIRRKIICISIISQINTIELNISKLSRFNTYSNCQIE